MGYDDLDMDYKPAFAVNNAPVDNSSLIDKEYMNQLKFQIKNTNLNSLNIMIKKDIFESEYFLIRSRLFQLMRTKIPGLNEIKKIIYKTKLGLKIEVYNPVVKVLFLKSDSNQIDDQYFSDNSFNIGISEFISHNDLESIFKELIYNHYQEYDIK